MILLKLVWRDFIRRRSMFSFAFLAIAAVCCLIVWFVGSLDTSSMAGNAAESYLGKYSLAIASNNPIPDHVFDAVRRLPGAVRISYGIQKPAVMHLKDFKEGLKPSGMGDRRSPMLTGIGITESPFELEDGRWFANPGECVVGESAEKLLCAIPGEESSRKIKIGDRIRVSADPGESELVVTGIFEQQSTDGVKMGGKGNGTFAFGFGLGIGGGVKPPAQKPAAANAQTQKPPRRRGPSRRGVQISPMQPCVYVSLDDADRITGNDLSLNIIYVELAGGVKETDYYAALEKEIGTTLKNAGLRTFDKRPPEPSAENMSPGMALGQAWSAIGLIIIASVFIIFTTLSMGVGEKIRQLAMLRTIGFTKTQVALFILIQGIALGLLGWIAGLFSGWLLITLLLTMKAGTWVPVILTAPCILFALLCSITGALIASILPAWRATCIAPAESMTRKNRNLTAKQLFLSGVTGLLLLALIPVMVFLLPCEVETKLLLFTTAGTFLLGAGFLLFFPWTLVITEKLFGSVTAKLFGFHRLFLTKVLTGNQWRTLGTTISISIGLGLFTAIHIWSSSMLSMFTVPDTIPNTIVRFQEGVISPETSQGIRAYPAIRSGHFLRLAVAQPQLDPVLAEKMQQRGAMAPNFVTFGLDAETAWRTEDPLLRLKFVEGSPAEVRNAFAKENARVCVIPETVSVHGDLHVGDTLKLAKSKVRKPSRTAGITPQDHAEYTVVGVVDFPWVWLSKCAGVRVSAGRTAGLIFVPYDAVLEDFGAPDGEFFWFDTVPDTEYNALSQYMRDVAKGVAANTDAASVRSYSGGTLWDSGINKYYVQVSSVESLNNSLNSRSDGVIDTMAKMPLIILILSVIAVLNTMIVSVRARRWEMGVLRACGITRGGLIRMILAESLLIGFCACVMSFSFGLFYAWIAAEMVEFAPVFGVIAPPLVIPWAKLAYGYLLAMAVCILAGIYPAISAGLRDAADLLRRKE